MFVRTLVLSSLVAASAHAAVGFSMSGVLGDETTVHVSRPTPGAVRFVVDFEPFPSPISNDPGCGVRLTPAEASHLGELYIWASSEWAPQAFYKEIPMRYGGEIRVERSPTMANIETALDDGTHLIGFPQNCVFSMDDEDAEMVGSWLYTAANP
ncbi:MAG TPA: hypothetical protein PK095_13275 [Myxococcota bacterium]|nr:hypothetical protein [Myxococcota bacterium]